MGEIVELDACETAFARSECGDYAIFRGLTNITIYEKYPENLYEDHLDGIYGNCTVHDVIC